MTKREELEQRGFFIGERDPRLNDRFIGKFMVVTEDWESLLPYFNGGTHDGSDIPCIVGDDLEELINDAYEKHITDAWGDI